MSIRAMSAVWERSSAKGSELLLLLAIADFADDDGRNAWPRIDTLAGKVRMSPRSVSRLIDKLVERGELVVDVHGGGQYDGPRRSNRYAIPLVAGKGDKMSGLDSGKGDKMSVLEESKHDKTGSKHDIAMSYDPSIDPSTTNNQENARARDDSDADSPIEKAARIITDSTLKIEDPAGVAALVERAYGLVQDLDREEAPAIAESFTRYYSSAPPSKQPKDWYRAWLNWLKVEKRKEANNGTANGRSRPAGALSSRGRGSDPARGARRLPRFDFEAYESPGLDSDG